MASLNKIMLIGHLGKDPELKHTQAGKTFCTFSMATTEKWQDAAGQIQERTEWHNVSVWTKAATACSNYLAKGSLVFVEGKLQSREYEKDGVKHRAWDVNAMNVVFLSRKSENGAREEAPAGYEHSSSTMPAGDDQDIPF